MFGLWLSSFYTLWQHLNLICIFIFQVEKVVVSKRGRSPVGFVHFTERSELDRSIKELNGKTIQGRTGGSTHKLQVEVARPMDRNKKRAHDNSESNPSVQGHSKILKEESSSAPSNNHVQRESETKDPYEDAVIALPLAVTERLLRILRLGIATRFDIDIKSLCSLKELPESIAISILDQFMLSGAALQNKGAYLTGLISQHLDKVGQSQSLVSLSKVTDISAKEFDVFSFSHRLSPPAVGSFSYCADSTSGPNIYSSNYSSPLSDYPFSSRTLIRRTEERGSDFHISNRTISGPQSIQNPRIGTLERSHSPLEATPPGSSIAYGNKVGLRVENVSPILPAHSSSIPYTRREISLSSEIAAALSDRQATRPRARFDPSDIAALSDRHATRPQVRINPFDFDRQATRPQVTFDPLDSAAVSNRQGSRSQVMFDPFNNEPVSNRQETRSQVTFDPFNNEPVSIRQATRPQVRFDPFTGEPYKFDPFTGEPIQPESREREF
ncbi:hypothetical protein ACJIZ3_002013 [Penstemon smallii]|uniref:Heterogeneous nuclear ribonucleoprotein Q acidic domain-containing protein n=1 Tax=Penstemon smallii TaxID=265156 RepID=A0ABD3U5M2_9LAMI